MTEQVLEFRKVLGFCPAHTALLPRRDLHIHSAARHRDKNTQHTTNIIYPAQKYHLQSTKACTEMSLPAAPRPEP